MGSRTPHVLVDTTPAKTIVVYRNGDQFYVGRKFVLSRRRVATFEALLEQLTEQVQAPFGVRRLFTPTRGRPVRELDALQAGGKYVAAGRERFKKLDYIHIVPRKPAKMRKSKDVKPVVHCDISVPSRWQTSHRLSRPINVFTNGRLFFPPVKIIIPRFCLTDWNCVLAVIGEKVFPLGGVRKLFTMNGRLLEDSKELQDNHFYVAVGLETFKRCPYWKSPRVPSAVRQKYSDMEKYSRRKKKDSVFYAKEGEKPNGEPFTPSRADGGVYKAQTLDEDTSGALEIKEAPDVPVDVPVDQGVGALVLGSPGLGAVAATPGWPHAWRPEFAVCGWKPAEMVKEAEETHRNSPDFESNKCASVTGGEARRAQFSWDALDCTDPLEGPVALGSGPPLGNQGVGCGKHGHSQSQAVHLLFHLLPFRRRFGREPEVKGRFPQELHGWGRAPARGCVWVLGAGSTEFPWCRRGPVCSLLVDEVRAGEEWT
ncbi:doublecortin domain-containing protein 2C [Phacochoerus africanus]|uniref:doublecortin domain-containing protein 2C n=1 Tax=Phacochoerus africanus TaxID=41426 RepID=UPI001FD8FD3E|nr:doublecortin domain-containing protein 2C [Phacochoerus africanus]